MSWATQRDRLLGKAPTMSLDEVIAGLRDLGGVLYVAGTDLRYVGPELDDTLSAGIDQHRAMLTKLFTYAPGRRCVFEDCYRLCGDGDKIACPDHRAQMEGQ